MNNDQEVFLQTLKRSCYILINNWDHAQKGSYIQPLVESFDDPCIQRFALGDMTQRLRHWLRTFIASPDYDNLRLFASRFEGKKKSWSDRYSHYQLINQAEDLSNSAEQREAAKALTTRVRNRFRLDLALYVAKNQQATSSRPGVGSLLSTTHRENPTGLGETTVNLIKSLVMRKGLFGPSNLARIFLDQVQDLSYEAYKDSLLNYLTYASTEEEKKQKAGFAALLRLRLSDRLNDLYEDKNDQQISGYLMLRTCNQVINFLTTENSQEPSPAFMLLVSQGHSLLLAIVLLKIILISPDSRSHLDLRIAKLVQYYIRLHQEKDLEESHYFGYFLDIVNVTLAIYTEGVSYNVVKHNSIDRQRQVALSETEPSNPNSESQGKTALNHLEGYRIFAQAQPVTEPVSQDKNPTPPAEPSPPVQDQPKPNRTVLYDAVTGEEIIFED
jgi:hypothetical protein